MQVAAGVVVGAAGVPDDPLGTVGVGAGVVVGASVIGGVGTNVVAGAGVVVTAHEHV